jgi:hypothetical protein
VIQFSRASSSFNPQSRTSYDGLLRRGRLTRLVSALTVDLVGELVVHVAAMRSGSKDELRIQS